MADDDDDLKKKTARASETVTDGIRWGAKTSTGIVSGIVDAFAGGLRAYSAELEREPKTFLQLGDSMTEAALAGLGEFFRKLAEGTDETLKAVRVRAESKQAPPPEPIDYERLAKLVVKELVERDLKANPAGPR